MQMNSNILSKTLLKSSFIFLFLLVACSNQLDTSMKNVEIIDAKYGIELGDYNESVTKFQRFIRDNPLNQEDLAEYIAELKELDQDEYVEFRLDLANAEKLYKSSIRRPFAAYNSHIDCGRRNETILSIDEARTAVMHQENALAIYEEQGWEFMPQNWPSIIRSENEKIISTAKGAEFIVLERCESPLEQS